MAKQNSDITLDKKPARKVIKLPDTLFKYDHPAVTATPSQDYYYSIISSKIIKKSSATPSELRHRPVNLPSKQPPLPQYFSMDDLPPSFDEVIATSTNHSRSNSIASTPTANSTHQSIEAFLTPNGDGAADTSRQNLLHTLQSWLPWTTTDQQEATPRQAACSDVLHQQELSSASSTSTPSAAATAAAASQQPPLKILGLKIFNSRFHFLLGLSRGLSVLPSFLGMWECFYQAWELFDFEGNRPISSVRSSELFMAGVWCIVSGYLSYAVLDGLMVRWIVTYSTPATIVRMFSGACLNIAMIQAIYSVMSPGQAYLLHVWIFISCILTVAYIIQNFVTSNLALEHKSRSVDLYNIAVFAVVPVGIASFLTMISLLWSLMILRIDLEIPDRVF